MSINIKISSKEMIKPSSSTPHHLKSFKLSYIDQTAPRNHVPIVLFYESQPSDVISLKESLSKNLTRYYPLAGRLSGDGFSVDCDDAGAEFVEARVEARISEIVENPDMDEIKKLLPLDPYDQSKKNVVLLAIQANLFACGGSAIAVCVSHKLADASSLVSFIDSWASQSLGKFHIPDPDLYSGYNLFQPTDLADFDPPSGVTEEHVVTKQLVFDKTKLENLKREKANSSITPSRVEAVCAFIWKSFIKSSRLVNNTDKMHFAIQAVNLRPKISPRLGEKAFGNIWSFATAVSISSDDQVEALREAVKNVDVKLLQDGKRHLNELRKLKEEVTKTGYIEYCGFSSWRAFPFYEVDYGWGKPVWACTTTFPSKRFVILMSTKDGEGVEAWVSCFQADIDALQAEHNFL